MWYFQCLTSSPPFQTVSNVPFLNEKRQAESLHEHCRRLFPDSKADLATAFVDRSLRFCDSGSSTCLVTTQNWLFLSSYKRLRQRLLSNHSWNLLVRLGARAFVTPLGAIPVLTIITRDQLRNNWTFEAIDASIGASISEKDQVLKSGESQRLNQRAQLETV